ncbi:MAG: PAS domain S-box protein, partial [candidate division Zixibacteria bacterium]|nr:PAS domain S-box protein [candidate division Zixibacteria bacterium]
MHKIRSYKIVLLLFIIFICCNISTTYAAKPKIITLPHSIDYPPLFYVDNDGDTKGILADYWRLWSQKSGIEIKFEPYQWHECVERVRNSESDLIPGIFYTADRDAEFDFSQSFMEVKTSLFARSSIGPIGIHDFGGHKVGVTRGDRSANFIREYGRNLTLKIYENFESVIIAAANKEIDIFAMDHPAAIYFLDANGISDEFISIQTLYVGKFCAAVKEGNLELLIYVNNGIEKINEDEITDIFDRWTPDRHRPSPEAIRFILIVGAVFLAIGIIVHNIVLRYGVRKRTGLLEKAEKKYRQLIENAYEGIVVSRGDKFVFVSPGMTRITGFSSKELLSWDQSYIVHADDKLFIKDRISKIESGRHVPTTYQIKIITKAGLTKWLQISSTMVEWEEQPAELEFITDITDLKQAQEALAKADEHLRAVVTVSPVPIIVSRLKDGKIMFANENLRRLVGYEKDELIGKVTPDFYYDPNDRKRIIEILTQKGKVNNVEVRMKKLDGTVFWAMFSLVITEIGGEKVIMGSLYDFSERKKIEEELQLYRQLFLNSQDGIVILDDKGNYIESNPIHLKRTGFTVKELKELGIDGILGPKTGSIFKDMMSSGNNIRREINVPKRDGGNITVDISAFIIRNNNNEITNFAGMGRDITKQKQAQKDVAKRLKYEEGLKACSSALLQESSASGGINKALGSLLKASEASHVYVCENFEDSKDGLCARPLYEARTEGVPSMFDDDQDQKMVYSQGFKRKKKLLSEGKPIAGTVDDFPANEAEMLTSEGVLSILILPIFVDDNWFGFIGFYDEKYKRVEMEDDI